MLHSGELRDFDLVMSERPDVSANDLVKNSNLYREFQAEREEILKHKWI